MKHRVAGMTIRYLDRYGAQYEVVSVTDKATTIRDLNGPRSLTNDAERVVREIFERGLLADGRRLYYYDSEGRLDELTFTGGGRFTGFAPGPRAGGVAIPELVCIIVPVMLTLGGSFTAAEILLKVPGGLGWVLALAAGLPSVVGAVAFAVHGTKRAKGGRNE